MKKQHLLLFTLLLTAQSHAQQKQEYTDYAELERITKTINISGQYLYRSGEQQLYGYLCIGIGTLLSVGGTLSESPNAIFLGAGVSIASIPLFVLSANNKKIAGQKMLSLELKHPTNIPEANPPVQNTNQAPTGSTSISKADPNYKLGQVVYFYKDFEVTEAKITVIDEVGLRVEYFDVEKNRTRTKFLDFNKVYVNRPE